VVSSSLATSEPVGIVDAIRRRTTHANKVRCFRQNRRRGSQECAHELDSWEKGHNRRRFEVHCFLFPKQEQVRHLWPSGFGAATSPSGGVARPTDDHGSVVGSAR
jgi:hypothetical protein